MEDRRWEMGDREGWGLRLRLRLRLNRIWDMGYRIWGRD
jgi:hypothetical protein